MIHKIKISYKDVDEINRIANQYPQTVIQIAQGNKTINAKSFLGYSILDFEKDMMLIIYDEDNISVLNSFNKWFI